jgi:uncharacterized protein (TIGR02145 family)
MKRIILLSVLLIGLVTTAFGQSKHARTKTRSHNSAPKAQASAGNVASATEVIIGSQTWAGRNLNVDRFRNGDSIPEGRTDEEWERATTEKRPAWCYYRNDASRGAAYGKLYNWYAVSDRRGLAPLGWHIPAITEWETLLSQFGGITVAGAVLRGAELGFNGIANSCRYSFGAFNEETGSSYWWTGPVSGGVQAYRITAVGIMSTEIREAGDGLSVRGVKD